MPGSVSVGRAEKKASKAARPPADAPMPTMGNVVAGLSGVLVSAGSEGQQESF